MKNLWVKISYWWFVIMLFFVGLLSGKLRVKADTLSYDFNSYAVRDNGTWTSHQSFGNNFSSKVMNGVSIRLGVNNQFRAGTTYRIIYMVGFSNIDIALEDILVLQPTDVNCYGSVNYSSWSSDSGLIATCNYIGASRVPNTTTIRYILEFSPVQNIKGYQTNIIFSNSRYTLSSTNVYTTTNITYPSDVSGTINEQTTIIQNEFNDLSNTITENNNNLINAITEDNKVCSTKSYNKSFVETSGSYLNSTGVPQSNSSNSISGWISINENTTIKQTYYTGRYSCFYTEDKTVISCIQASSSINNTEYTIPSNAKYFRYTINNNLIKELYVITTCNSGNQSMQDTLTDSSVDDPSDFLSDMEDLLPSNGVITQLITLPITLYQKVLNSINGTCSQFDLGELYGTHLIMPCINLQTYLGNSLWNTIDLIMSGVFVLVIARKMIKAFNSFTFMKEGDVIND